jgi:hypothetical protein
MLQGFASQNAKPTLQGLLDAMAAALNHRPRAYLDDAPPSGHVTLAAILESPAEALHSEFQSGNANLIKELNGVLEEIAMEYEESEMSRKPRLSEVLASLVFVLNGEPEMYLSCEWHITQIKGRWL